MKSITKRAALAATVLMTVFTLANADGSDAFAQDVENEDVALQADQAEADATQEPQIRFVTEEVVQPLPEESDAVADVALNAGTLRELVSSMAGEGQLSRDMRCLAQAIYFESRGEPLAGQLAVGRVIVNRTESSLFPDSYCGVVTQRAQFSFVRNGRIPAPNTATDAWKRAKAVARIAHQELWESEAHDALFFHATYVKPRWARSKVARATIQRHIFYR